MPKDTRINLVVNAEKKERWEAVVEDSTEYDTLSRLIRKSVEGEIADTNSNSPTNSGENRQNGANDGKLDEISETLANIQRQIVELEDRVVTVEKEVTAESTANLKNEVYAALPLESNQNEPDGKTAEQIAEQIGADRDEVSSVLLSLQTDTGTVDEGLNPEPGRTAWVRKE